MDFFNRSVSLYLFGVGVAATAAHRDLVSFIALSLGSSYVAVIWGKGAAK